MPFRPIPVLAALVALISMMMVLPAGAEPPVVMTYVYRAPDSGRGPHYLFRWELLRAALEQTRTLYGPYELRAGRTMPNNRFALGNSDEVGAINVAVFGGSPDHEAKLLKVPIPIDKGLVGYRLLLIRQQNLPRFAAIETIADLKKIRLGQEFDWRDAEILRANGMNVDLGSNYDGLFQMLARNRFDAFPRGVGEINDERDMWLPQIPDLIIEPRLVIYYPMTSYFWFARSTEGRALARRVEEGLRQMIANGSYEILFRSFFQKEIERLALNSRVLVRLHNPDLPEATLEQQPGLWLTPAQLGITASLR